MVFSDFSVDLETKEPNTSAAAIASHFSNTYLSKNIDTDCHTSTFGNKMKKSFTHILIAGALLAGGAFGGYFWGHRKGLEEGFMTGATQADYHQNIRNSVYLTLAAKKHETGDQREADRLQQLLLFGSALEIQNAIESGSLSKEELEKTPAEGVLKEVAAYYWRHPETIKILDDDPARRHLKPQLLSFFKAYQTAEPSDRSDRNKPSN